MDKQLVKRLLTTTPINHVDLGNFLYQYVLLKKNHSLTSEELQQMIAAISFKMLDLDFALLAAARELGLYVMDITDKEGNLIKRHVYETSK